jgi:alpha-1,2-mannosyltransferase
VAEQGCLRTQGGGARRRLPARHILCPYDLTILAVAVAFFARHGLAHGFRDYEITLLAGVWCAPLLARAVALDTGIPLGLIAQAALFIIIVDRARHKTRSLPRSESLAPA